MNIENRKILYYHKYLYKAKLEIPYARYMSMSKTFGDFCEFGARFSINFEKVDKVITQEFINFINSYDKKQLIIRIENKYVSIFCNDLNNLKTTSKLFGNPIFYKANAYDDNVIIFKNYPKHKFRTYLKQGYLNKSQKHLIYDFINRHVKDRLDKTISKSFYRKTFDYINPYNEYWHGSHFIDYDDESFKTLIHLFIGNLAGKTYKLVWVHDKDKYSYKTECLDGENSRGNASH